MTKVTRKQPRLVANPGLWKSSSLNLTFNISVVVQPLGAEVEREKIIPRTIVTVWSNFYKSLYTCYLAHMVVEPARIFYFLSVPGLFLTLLNSQDYIFQYIFGLC